jgi:hypothetical protein
MAWVRVGSQVAVTGRPRSGGPSSAAADPVGAGVQTPGEPAEPGHDAVGDGDAGPVEVAVVAGPVEVIDGGHPAGVRVGAEVAPLLQLPKRGLDSGKVGRLATHVFQRSGQVFRPQVHQEPALGRHERAHDSPVQLGVGRIQVRERLGLRLLGHQCRSDEVVVAAREGSSIPNHSENAHLVAGLHPPASPRAIAGIGGPGVVVGQGVRKGSWTRTPA